MKKIRDFLINKIGKKGAIKTGLVIILLTLVFVLVFFYFSHAVAGKKSVLNKEQYVIGEKVKIDLSGYKSYTLKIITPSNTYIKQGSDSMITFSPEEIGSYKVEIVSSSGVADYGFDVVDAIINDTNSDNSSASTNNPDNSGNSSASISIANKENAGINNEDLNNFSEANPSILNNENGSYVIGDEKNISENVKEVHIKNGRGSGISYVAVRGIPISEKGEIKVYSKDEKKYVDFDAEDTNGDGIIDRVEWQAVSNYTYDIIIATKAEHLDENRTFVEDVYDAVKAKDGDYATIPSGDYLRVSFEKNLTKENDITLYAKADDNGTNSIEVYRKDDNTLVASFENVSGDNWYKIYLTNLGDDSIDTFDLKSMGDVSYDYIVDPTIYIRAGTGATNSSGNLQPSFGTAMPSVNYAPLISGESLVTRTMYSMVYANKTVTGFLIEAQNDQGNNISAGNLDWAAIQFGDFTFGSNTIKCGTNTSSLSGGLNRTTFPSAFPNTNYAVIANSIWDGDSPAINLVAGSKTTTYFNVSVRDDGAAAEAIREMSYCAFTIGEYTISGLQIKAGNTTTAAAGDTTVSFGAAFPNTNYAVLAMAEQSGTTNCAPEIVTKNVGSFTIHFESDAAANCASRIFSWVAIQTGTFTLDQTNPLVSIKYPGNVSYNVNVSALNYTASDDVALDVCKYSLNGAANTTVACGTNATGLTSTEGSNTWTVYVNDTSGNKNSSNITFFKDTIFPLISFGTGVEVDGANKSQTWIYANVSVIELNEKNITFSLFNSSGPVNSSTFTNGQRTINWTGLIDNKYWYNVTIADNVNNVNSTSTLSITLDDTSPLISFGTGTEVDGANKSQTWIYANVSVTEANEKNITFNLYNSSGPVNSTTFTNKQRTINWTGLPDGIYFYNVTVVDYIGYYNSTSTYNITLDDTFPLISFGTGTEVNASNESQNWVYVNVSATELNEKNITFSLFNSSGSVNATTFTNGQRTINWTNLADGKYFYNVTIADIANNVNSTSTLTITLDDTFPLISFGTGTNVSGTYDKRTWIYVNVSVTEINGRNITFSLSNSTGSVNITTLAAANRTINWTNLADGIYFYNVTFTDIANNRNSTSTYNITLDDTFPLISFGTGTEVNASNESQNWVYVNVSVTELNEKNITFSLFNSSGPVNSSTFTNGQRTINWTNLADGKYFYNVTIADIANNVNSTSTLTITLDDTFPLISFGTGTLSDYANASQNSVYVNVSVTEINGRNITFSLFNDTGSVNITTLAAANRTINWTGLPDGDYYYNVTFTDIVNNQNSTPTRTITLDKTNPRLVIVYPLNKSNLSSNNFDVNYTVSDSNLQACWWTKNAGGANATITCGTNITGQTWIQGNNTVSIYVNDTIGNKNSSSVLFFVDSVFPLISFGTGTLSDYANASQNSVYVNVSVTEINGRNITFSLFNDTGSVNITTLAAANRTINWTGLPDGDYYYNVTFTDIVNNQNSTPTRTITLDKTNPRLVIVYPLNKSNLSSNNFDVNYTVSDSNLQACWWTKNAGGANATITCGTNITGQTWIQGNNTVSIYVNDTIGNKNSSSVLFFVDSVFPLISFGTGTLSDYANASQNSVYVNVSVTEINGRNITFSLFNDTGSVNITTLAAANRTINWTGLPDGDYYYNVTFTDIVNNQNSTPTRTITLDKTNPRLVIVYPLNKSNLSSNNFDVNYTVSDSNLQACWWTKNAGGANATITCGTNITGQTWIQGNNTVSIYVNDTIGNKNSSSVLFFVDSVFPLISFGTGVEVDGANKSQTWIYANVSVTEANEKNITFSLFNSSGPVNSSTFTNGQRTINWTGLPDGDYWYNVTITDSVNNVNSTSTLSITLDNTYPLIFFGTGTNASGTYDKITWVYVNVSATELNEKNITFSLFNSSGSVNATTFTNGQRTINWTELFDGIYFYNVTVVDYVGHYNSTSTYNITLDNISPLISFGTGVEVDGANKSQTWIYANVSVTEANEKNITFSLFNSTGPINSTTFTDKTRTINWTGLPDGNYWYNVTVYDNVNYANSTSTLSITLDNTYPLIFFGIGTSPNGTSIEANAIYVNVSVIEANEENITFLLFNSSDQVNSTTFTDKTRTINWTNLPDGNYWYNVSVEDFVGHVNTSSTWLLTLDNAPPLVYIFSPVNKTYDSNVIDFNFSIVDSNTQSCSYSNDFGQTNHTILCLNTVYNANQETNVLFLYANDTAGNGNSSNVTFFVDSIFPLVSYSFGTENDGVNKSQNWVYVNVSVIEVNEDNITFSLYNITGTVSSTTFTDKTRTINWTGLIDNDYWYDVEVDDSLGNVNVTPIRQITLDTTKPVINFGTGTLANGASVEDTSIYVNVSVIEVNERNITFSLFNSTGPINSTTFTDKTRTINWTGLDNANTTYYYNVTMWDYAGNFNSSSTYSIKLIDLTPPNLTLISPLSQTYDDNDSVSLEYSASDAHLDSCWYTLNAGGNVNLPGCAGTTLGVPEGSNTLHLFANDSLANIVNVNVTFVANKSLIVTDDYYVQRGEISVNGQTNVTINKIDKYKSFVMLDARGATNTGNAIFVSSNIYNSTRLSLQNYAGGAQTVDWEVITGPDISVQRNNVTFNSTLTSVNVTINAVDLTNSFIIVQVRLNSNTASRYPQGLWAGEFINPTKISFRRDTSGNDAGEIYWQVVSWNGMAVQSGSLSLATVAATSHLPSPVVTSNTFLVTSYSTNGATVLDDYIVAGELYNTTDARFYRGGTTGTGTAYIRWFVVSGANLKVQRGKNLVAAVPVNVTLPSNLYYTNKTFRTSGTNNSGANNNNANAVFTSRIVNTTTVQLTKGTATNTNTIAWQTIEFIERDSPVVNIINPVNNTNFSSAATSQFNYSVSDQSPLKNCTLYGNWTGAWAINQTVTSPLNDFTIQNFSAVNVSVNKFYIWNVECTDIYGNIGRGSGNFTFSAFLPAVTPSNLSISQSQNDGNGNVLLRWNSSTNAYNYRIYKTTDISLPFTLLNSTTNTNYTDTSANSSRRTFYEISAYNPLAENISTVILGKTVYTLTEIDGVNTRNWIGLPFNYTVLSSANKTLYEIPNTTSVTMWDENAQKRVTCNQFFCPMDPECGDACNFNMDPGRGYEVNINSSTSVNWSVVGAVYDIINMNLTQNVSSYGKNWVAMNSNTSLTNAQGLIESIIVADAVTDWNPDTQASRGYIKSPFPGIPYIGTNFPVEIEKGYEVAVRSSSTWTQD